MNRFVVPTLALGLLLLLAACGRPQVGDIGAEPSDRTRPDTVDEHDGPGDLDAPPPVTVRYAQGAAELEPWTFCYGNGCADGMPPEDPHEVGSPEEVLIEFPLEGWTFNASFETADQDCGREFSARAEPLDDGRFVLRPAGYAGTYDVTLFGRGPDGDLFVTFRWSTPSDGPLPEPKGTLAVLADHDGELDSYGVELTLSDLAETPKNVGATIAVRAADGDEVVFDAKQARGCRAEGSVFWDGPDDQGLAAAQLSGERFTYEVEVTLGDQRYAGTAMWPDDVIPGNEPSVSLDFEPDLPALQP